jgi:hypothetical protein
VPAADGLAIEPLPDVAAGLLAPELLVAALVPAELLVGVLSEPPPQATAPGTKSAPLAIPSIRRNVRRSMPFARRSSMKTSSSMCAIVTTRL